MEDKLTGFKEYVRRNPGFVSTVRKGEATWQSLYELYVLYGEDESVFNKYLQKDISIGQNQDNNGFISSLTPVLDALKGLDMKTVQKGIDSLQKGIGLLQEFTSKDNSPSNTYTPRAVNKYFDD